MPVEEKKSSWSLVAASAVLVIVLALKGLQYLTEDSIAKPRDLNEHLQEIFEKEQSRELSVQRGREFLTGQASDLSNVLEADQAIKATFYVEFHTHQAFFQERNPKIHKAKPVWEQEFTYSQMYYTDLPEFNYTLSDAQLDGIVNHN